MPMLPVAGVSMTMAAVQEQMQHWTQEEQHIREGAKHMRPMFSDEKERGNGQEPEQHQPARCSPPARELRLGSVHHMSLLFHHQRAMW
jgi:hypothetical protein